ncbi:endo-1,4-beta-xylanase [Alicyclobacillus sendaiensis]|uniref:Beta-xylanase n=1 Tax=Alicyclobacillus sendaiensis PA2 TaxID=3029425 RepID=A0ABT6XY82_ALISE|nr:endo-1,4-beta-xylanase [Alicyclobacillus sendaiensis]MDI9260045.1 endo-1,4-beta-xylanase [Alicyclobacillus sendaiensis PA2]
MPHPVPSLKEAYASHFRVGAAVNAKTIHTHADLLERHFSSLTPENEMKWERIHPAEDTYAFSAADQIVLFARDHGMFVRGHTLVWHNQTPSWVFQDALGQSAPRKLVQARLEAHIAEVVGRYRGAVSCWDVVNEAVIDQGEGWLRPSPWRQALGDDYIETAFRLAHQADPGALLFYNDYNETRPEKRERILRLVEHLLDRGAPVHGVGLQMHVSLDDPPVEEMEEAIERYRALGLRLHVTELDVSVYPWVHEPDRPQAPARPYDEEMAERLAARYEDLFRLFLRHRDVIDNVTLWGVADDSTWRDDFPVKGRKDFPLLFDVHHAPKEAFWRVVGVAER